MRILVTGGAGFIGSHVADAYIREGHDVTVLDDLSSGKKQNVNAGAKLLTIDVRDPNLSNVFAKSQFEIVATEANTVVQYQLRRNGILDPTVNNATLNNPGDVLQIQDAQDLSGSVIESVG